MFGVHTQEKDVWQEYVSATLSTGEGNLTANFARYVVHTLYWKENLTIAIF